MAKYTEKEKKAVLAEFKKIMQAGELQPVKEDSTKK